ncbi:MAG: hypothetical protein NHG36_20100 [Chromatiaceae bacterium]|nr:hypothetical protein [Candidatus Thioaporhodococcus sediminis]
MSNLLGFATARKNSRAELLASWLDGGEIRVYDGTRPASADTAVSTQTVLVTFEIADPAGDIEDGIFTGDAIAVAMVAETGTAAWARVVDDAAATVFDCDVGLTGSGEMIEIDNLSLVEGGYCSITSFTITEG